MRKIVTLRIEVDLDSEASKGWSKKSDFFESEVDNVLDKLSSIVPRDKSKYSSEEGTTEDGSKFKIVVKKVK
jgi:ribosome-associated translation inhibitor RaiA